MRSKEIKALIEESRREGGITALEEYDRTHKLPFQKEVVAFTIRRDLMQKFRAKHKNHMSGIVEKQIQAYLKRK